VRHETAIGATFAQALEVRDRPGIDVGASIISTLGTRRSLIVVDNCEHLVAGVAELVGQLVGGCPNMVVVASSRERLGLRAERIYEVPPMAVGDGQALFVERASTARPGFEPDERVTEICDAVDQLPLAIELAAARVRVLSTTAIHERLSERLGLLATRDRDVEERQRTLEATIAWSYDLLDDRERRVLRSLSAFAGGCTLPAAEAVAGANVDSLESLLDKSLIRHRMDEAGQDRYWMLETIREYAQRELEREGEADATDRHHIAFFADLATRVDAPSTLAVSDEQRDLFVSDRANFGEAHARALASGDGASALQFVRRVGRVTGLVAPGNLRDMYTRAVASIALPGGAREDRAWALVRTARLAIHTGDFARARRWLDEADALFEELGDGHGAADALGARCVVEVSIGNYDLAVGLAERLRALGQALDDADPAAAAARPRTPSEAEQTLAWALLGRALEEDDHSAAERSRALLSAMAEAAAAGTVLEQAASLNSLALSLYVLGAHSDGIATGQRALGKLLELEAILEAESGWVSDSLFAIGISLCGRGDAKNGVRLVSAARRMYREDGIAEWTIEQAIVGRIEKSARAVLGDEGYEAAVRSGEGMPRDDAIELAVSIATD
jgi:predicted ATPase